MYIFIYYLIYYYLRFDFYIMTLERIRLNFD